MKLKFLFFVLLFSISFTSKSQKLQLKDLQYILSNKLDLVETYVSKKGLYYAESNIVNESCNSITWWNKDNAANKFDIYLLSKQECKDPARVDLFYTFYKKDIYDALKTEILSKGYKSIATTIDDKNRLKISYNNLLYRIDFFQEGKRGIDEPNTYRVIFSYK
jgi:hypothetical protein